MAKTASPPATDLRKPADMSNVATRMAPVLPASFTAATDGSPAGAAPRPRPRPRAGARRAAVSGGAALGAPVLPASFTAATDGSPAVPAPRARIVSMEVSEGPGALTLGGVSAGRVGA